MESPVTLGCVLCLQSSVGTRCQESGADATKPGAGSGPLCLWPQSGMVPSLGKIVHTAPLSAQQTPGAERWMSSVVTPSWWALGGTGASEIVSEGVRETQVERVLQ